MACGCIKLGNGEVSTSERSLAVKLAEAENRRYVIFEDGNEKRLDTYEAWNAEGRTGRIVEIVEP